MAVVSGRIPWYYGCCKSMYQLVSFIVFVTINEVIMFYLFYLEPVWWYSRQLVPLNNMRVMGSSPEWTVPSYVGRTDYPAMVTISH